MPASPTQRYLAEFVGTFVLLLFGGGAAVFSLYAASALDPLTRVLLVSLSFGSAVAGLAWVFGDISGGHFNPAVTASMALARRMPGRDVLPYLVAQIAGAILGLGVVFVVVAGGPGGADSSSLAATHALASQCYAASDVPAAAGCQFSLAAAFLIEVAMTFAFVLVIQLVTRPESSAKNLAPLAIGLVLMVTNLAAIPVDGASINPARSLAPALLSLYWRSQDGWALEQVWLFWVAPILGGAIAALVTRVFRTASS